MAGPQGYQPRSGAVRHVDCKSCGKAFSYAQKTTGRVRKFCDGCRGTVAARATQNSATYRQKYLDRRKAAGLAWHEGRKKHRRDCAICGNEYETSQHKSTVCSAACLNVVRSTTKKPEEEKRLKKQSSWQRRRARKSCAPVVEKVDLLAICERDLWTCWLCGGAAPRELRGKNDPMAPTADHVIPLARGGNHTAANLKCAHLSCNLSKGAKMPGELAAKGKSFSREIAF